MKILLRCAGPYLNHVLNGESSVKYKGNIFFFVPMNCSVFNCGFVYALSKREFQYSKVMCNMSGKIYTLLHYFAPPE